MEPTAKITRPAIKYFGGKFLLAPWIISLMPPHRVYIEPFCGGASVFFRKTASDVEIINDLNGDVINLYGVLRDKTQASELERLLWLTPFARAEFYLSYEPCEDRVERARRLVVRSFMGVSSASATRLSRSGWGSTTHPGVGVLPVHQWAKFPRCLVSFMNRLQGVTIENLPALEICEKYSSVDSLIYADPPYLESTRGEALGNYRHEMDENDHRTLALMLNRTLGAIMVSGYASPLYEEIYTQAGWTKRTKDTRDQRASVKQEVLWMNPAAIRLRQQQELFTR